MSDQTTPRSDGQYPAVPPPPPHGAVPPPPPPAFTPPPARANHRRGLAIAAVGVGAALLFGAGSAGLTYAITEAHANSGTTAAPGITELVPNDQGQTQNASSPATDATEEQEAGLVYINTVVGYGDGGGAGTGMILTKNGTILTNHHVIEGATKIEVEVVSTGETYQADVVGYDATADVAVLQLQDASNLTTVSLDTAQDVAVGDAITAVGNANGDGGAASAAAGVVTDLDQSITAQSSTGSEELAGLIEVDADVVGGDSGGALYDEDGDVIGMTTAASSGQQDIVGYAVPIRDALTVAKKIVAGTETETNHLGDSAFLGVQLDPQSQTPLVAGTIEDTAAAEAQIAAGSTITSFEGTPVNTPDELSGLIAEHAPGDSVTLTWVDGSGAEHTATVTLKAGPVG
ncbi:S1C family serine protease [Aeromicrobium alkaliterrae]|uniref:Trypsin-like peptidase domain-containing protein n=1 Tax=Aeromicrobium alkaliterrae TaxID=302168 RepID=A0ABP4VIG8_9ACTN